MKISKLIEALQEAQKHHGDIQCLIEIVDEGFVYKMPVDELSFEDREGFGPSICLRQ